MGEVGEGGSFIGACVLGFFHVFFTFLGSIFTRIHAGFIFRFDTE